ncbi:hypothetical protein [Mucilaginibacter sp. dw_454]|uniref:hypothetical protein n=1 Tax=Mucilaginibacter sp. dw_454 TaxID=2720079 RepID=UPI001BD2D4CB|nr:hypothetical protein [Mucilaginibacter sp. dw_454]
MKNFKQSILAITALFFLNACSKSSPGTSPANTGHNVKFTITVAGGVAATNRGLIDLVFNAAGSNNKTIWTINSVQQQNATLLTFDGISFPAGATTTFVIQSIAPVPDTRVHLDFGNAANLPAYTISYKAEIDGKVQNDDENIVINGTTSYEHDYSY